MGDRVFQPTVFQNNVFQVGTVTPVSTGGGAGVVLHSYTRKRHRELMAEILAELQAKEKKLKAKPKKAVKAAIAEAKDSDLLTDAELAHVAEMYQAAVKARGAADTIAKAMAAAKAMREAMEEMDDEEAIMVLI